MSDQQSKSGGNKGPDTSSVSATPGLSRKRSKGRTASPIGPWHQVVWAVVLVLSVLVVVLQTAPSLDGIEAAWSQGAPVEDSRGAVELNTVVSAKNTAIKSAVEMLSKQNDTNAGFSGALLAALVGLVLTTTVHRVPGVRVIYLLVGPAAAYLLTALWATNLFQRRLTYLTIKQNYSSYESLASLVTLEGDCLKYAVFLLALFVAYFLSCIVMGLADPRTQEDSK